MKNKWAEKQMHYVVYVNGKPHSSCIGIKMAMKLANSYVNDLFNNKNHYIEIIDKLTGEVMVIQKINS